MKKPWLILILVLSFLTAAFLFTKGQQVLMVSILEGQRANQEFLSKKQLLNDLINISKINKSKINEENIWVQYVDMDQDPELELLVSYRYEVHKGYFFIYDYTDEKYKLVFTRPWAIEKMSGHDVIVASGDNKTHQLQAKIIHMFAGEVKVLWEAIIDRYDYTDLTNGIELHGHYYVDTNAVLNYFYKIEKTDKNAKVLNRTYHEESFIWDMAKNKYIKTE